MSGPVRGADAQEGGPAAYRARSVGRRPQGHGMGGMTPPTFAPGFAALLINSLRVSQAADLDQGTVRYGTSR